MYSKLKFFITALALLGVSLSLVQAQPSRINPKGLIMDDASYSDVPMKARLVSRGYSVKKSRSSLKAYCPTVGDQGDHGTCVGWSVAWNALTTLYAYENDITDQMEIDKVAFSPGYIYANIRQPDDYACTDGAIIEQALRLAKDKGVPRFATLPEGCVDDIPLEAYEEAKKYKIKDYARLFPQNASKDRIISTVKKALDQNHPVIIGLNCPMSFQMAGEVWTPVESPGAIYGGHALCVVGYDEDKYGGAFEIVNSWGTSWGNMGYVWVKYDDFAGFTKYAFEVAGFVPEQEEVKEEVRLAGSFRLVKSGGEAMVANFTGERRDNVKTRGFSVVSTDDESHTQYQTADAYPSGTRFRMYIKNDQPAYVYAIGSDLTTGNIFPIFPHEDGISALLDYEGSEIAIPSEDHYVQMDNTVGTDYFCVIFSLKELDFASLVKEIELHEGNFSARVAKALEDKLVKPEDVQYHLDEVGFETTSEAGSIVTLMIEMEHTEP